MRKYLGLGCVALLAAAGPAAAEGSEDAGVSANVQASCSLTTLLDSVETITEPFPGEHDLGNLAYICNFGNGLQYPSLRITYVGGTALVNTTDGDTVQYQVKWGVTTYGGPPQFHTAAPPTSGFFQFPGDQGALPNVEQAGLVIIDLLGDLTHAGTYSDVLTFSVSP